MMEIVIKRSDGIVSYDELYSAHLVLKQIEGEDSYRFLIAKNRKGIILDSVADFLNMNTVARELCSQYSQLKEVIESFCAESFLQW